jgi:hypothetical protein
VRPLQPSRPPGLCLQSSALQLLWEVPRREVPRVPDIPSHQGSRSERHAQRPPSICPEVTSGRRGQSRNAVKPISPLDGDPERAGLKRSQGRCVLVYVGPELRRRRRQDNQQCMTTMIQDDLTYPERELPSHSAIHRLPLKSRTSPPPWFPSKGRVPPFGGPWMVEGRRASSTAPERCQLGART